MRLGHRSYDASVGRFLSRDPIQDGYNWFTYVGNDPVNGVDPEGREGHPAIAYNDTDKDQWVIITPVTGKKLPVIPGNPKKKEPPFWVSIPNGPNLPAYPVYPIDEKGKKQPADPKKFIVPLPPKQSIGDGTNVDVDGMWGNDGKWHHPRGGFWGWTPTYYWPIDDYPDFRPGGPGSHYSGPP